MKSNQRQFKFLINPQILLVAFILLAILIPTIGFAKKSKKRHRKSRKWEIRLNLNTFYDSNILKYSDKYLTRFQNQQDPGRFHINSIDDIVLLGSLQVKRSLKIFGNLKSTFSVGMANRKYTNNPIKDWYSVSAGLRQSLPLGSQMYISYNYIPDFYVRHFRDDNLRQILGYTPETFKPFKFSKQSFSGWFQQTFFRDTRVRFKFFYMRYSYNQYFAEYNSNNLVYGMELYKPLGKNLRFNLEYRFTNSRADGYGIVSLKGPDATVADASYKNDYFLLGMLYHVRIFKVRGYFQAKSQYQRRRYTTKQLLTNDRLHVGRVDTNLRFYFSYTLRLNRNFDVTGFYNWQQRNSDTFAQENQTLLSDEKDYQQYQTGLKLAYSFKF